MKIISSFLALKAVHIGLTPVSILQSTPEPSRGIEKSSS